MRDLRVPFLASFEGLRGFAALGIFVYHFHHVRAFDALTSKAPVFFGQGWMFVDLFFVLSGWVMAHVYFAKLSHRKWSDVAGFMVARVARLYPLHVTVVLSWFIIFHVLGGDGLDSGTLSRLASQLSMTFTWGDLATRPFVAPTWSISAEFAAYLLFPVLVWAGVPATRLRAIALILGGVAGYVLLHSAFGTIHVITGMAPVRAIAGFVIGVGMWKLVGDSQTLANARILEALALVVFTGTVLTGMSPFGFLAAGILLVCAVSTDRGLIAQVLQMKAFQVLGRLSFSMYMWHWFVIVAFQNLSTSFSATEGLVVLAGTVIGVLIWLEFSVRYIEQPMGRALKSLLKHVTYKPRLQFRGMKSLNHDTDAQNSL
ncbi:acyltransferase family protein [Neptunicoccus cionae]|uniref:acyltransferase family protein n=1 Tax=Neptunicoccus cionae TaxID=2035344 RepID=UPI000C760043|nr:acyltransferase [Amylibacter cionae]PLS20458.1 hypothetical protein C0U40_17680 [Amylibacter cionae]